MQGSLWSNTSVVHLKKKKKKTAFLLRLKAGRTLKYGPKLVKGPNEPWCKPGPLLKFDVDFCSDTVLCQVQDVTSTLACSTSPLKSFRDNEPLASWAQRNLQFSLLWLASRLHHLHPSSSATGNNYILVRVTVWRSYFGGMTTSGAPLRGLHISTWASLAFGLPSALGGMGSW